MSTAGCDRKIKKKKINLSLLVGRAGVMKIRTRENVKETLTILIVIVKVIFRIEEQISIRMYLFSCDKIRSGSQEFAQ